MLKKCQVLVDKSASGKTRDWAKHKYENRFIALAYKEIDKRKAERMEGCANWLAFVRKEETLKLHSAMFCRVRLCPVCQWRRSLKTFAQMSQVLSTATSQGYQFIFLTLTVKNCKGDKLSDELTALLLAFNKLTKYKDVKAICKGYYRGCEVTHNISTDEFHPHLHCILAVNKSYFKSKTYLSHARWTELWQRALKVNYTPIVDVRRCNGGVKAVAEACKYTVKPSELLDGDWDMTVETVRTLDSALENRRFIGLGGIFKDIHRALHLDDMEDGDLVNLTDEQEQVGTDEEIYYFWNGYNRYERFE